MPDHQPTSASGGARAPETRGRHSSPRERSADALLRSAGALSSAAVTRMEAEVGWFRELDAQARAWVGAVLQAGIAAFVDWYRLGERGLGQDAEIAASVFGAAPRTLTGVISLRQTVDLVRLAIEVVESNVDALVPAEDAPHVHAAVLRYGREIAFATAEIYARAAEMRGAWDARLEALVVDSALREEPDETVLSRASALGWGGRGTVTVLIGSLPQGRTQGDVFDDVRRTARARGMDALCATRGELLVVVLGGVDDPLSAARPVAELYGSGPVVVGPAAEDLHGARTSAAAALAAHSAAGGWPGVPRPARADDLLPERALAGDDSARRHLVEHVYRPLTQGRGELIATLSSYFEHQSTIEAAARSLFVHPNTVRYRLRQVGDLTGQVPTTARGAFTLQVALVLGRQAGL